MNEQATLRPHRLSHFFLFLIIPILLAAGLASAVSAAPTAQPAAPLVLGWVGAMWPAGGSTSTITAGDAFDVYVQVWKDGVTNAPGQGADISCTLHWSEVDSFGGSWLAPTNTATSYHTDIGNNDEYVVAIAPGEGLYEFTAFCTDLTDDQDAWQPDGNGQLIVLPSSGPITDARSLWVEEAIIAWNYFGAQTYELHYDLAGELTVPATAGSGVNLTWDGALTGDSYAKFPNVDGYDAWRIGAGDLALIPTILKSEMAIAAYDSGGNLLDATGVQIQGVLDDLYSYAGDLGVTYSGGAPSLKVWAPTAQSVTLHRFADAISTTTSVTASMSLDPASGVWSIAGDASWDRQYYLYEVVVYAPATGQIERNLVTDPYSVDLAQNSLRSHMVDLANDAALKPAGWDSLVRPPLAAPEDIAVYEVHVRDFSIGDLTVPAAHRGTFMAFTDSSSNGMQHLLALQEAGLTHVHLLPAFDIASVNENAAARQEPDPDELAAYPPDSPEQQRLVGETRYEDGFNWGYDPYHYGVPEGSYATDQDDGVRILEFREMVQALHENGLRVVMDVVYNHTHAAGQDATSVLDRVVPGYYHRYDNAGNLANSSCCADTASEFAMMEKLMIDMTVRWAAAYQVDGFRFDLMNLHTVANAEAVRDAVQAVDATIYAYGEGWDFGSAKDKGLHYASQWNAGGTGIGTFNDRIRDAAHGGYSTDSLQIRHQGFINGLSYDWNGYFYENRDQGALHYEMNRLRVALAGSLRGYGNGTGYTLDPQETINYVSKHDNETLYDQNVFKLPWGEGGVSMAERVRAQNMGLSIAGLAQGVPFFHLGSDMLRSKSLDRNSYDSGDWFNKVDFTYQSNNFGVGLPPAWDNGSRWPIMQPLLADLALQPASTAILSSTQHLREVLRLRQSSPLFRLRTAEDILARVRFFNEDNGIDGLIAMGLSDDAIEDLDPDYEYILVFFNANKVAQNFTIEVASDLPFVLHPLQADAIDADPVVQGAGFDQATGVFSIPARTMAVFVSTVAPQFPSTIDWVGRMWPRGGQSQGIPQGQASGDFEVYVQVYKSGVTSGPGQGPGIECYLHWGRYGQPWQDLPMDYNGDVGDNDEYKGVIPEDVLNGLDVGTYGFTAYCTDDGGASKRWKQDGHDLDYPGDHDVGDGIISILPLTDPRPAAAGGVFVHLFEWTWADVEIECEYLAEKGYSAVQVSPPTDHITGTQWWTRYQPVTYTVYSRSGTPDEFQSMVDTCNALGVDIYVDAVINHMAAGPTDSIAYSFGGIPYMEHLYPHPDGALYDENDFHIVTGACPTDDGGIDDYADRRQVHNCELLGLDDLDTGDSSPDGVQDTIAGYLQGLLDRGVGGFRIDAAKHIFTYDIEQIVDQVPGDYYLFQEVIEGPGEPVQGFEYFLNGDVTEFDFSNGLGYAFICDGVLADLQDFGSSGAFMDSQFAVVFTDNHDNQRSGGCIVTHKDGPVYDLANVFALAWPYGYPKVMSSYGFDDDDQGPPDMPVHPGDELNCELDGPGGTPGLWQCEHRRPAIANMVEFRRVVDGEPVVDWWDNGADQIAFGRGEKGYVAINREPIDLTRIFTTSLPAGEYCDVTKGELNAAGTACTGPTIVVVDAPGHNIIDQTVAALDAFAIHADARIIPCTLPTQPTLLSPPNGASEVPTKPTLEWSAASGADEYYVEVATDADFGNVIYTATVTETSHVVATSLRDDTTHYWRVTPRNACGDGPTSAAFSFTTEPICVAEVVLAGKAGQSDLTALRQFRDQVLAASPAGRAYIDLYYRHSPELMWMLLWNAELRARTAEVLGELMPGVRNALGQAGGRETVFTAARIGRISALLDEYARRGSPELQAMLQRLQSEVASYQGRTLRQVWASSR